MAPPRTSIRFHAEPTDGGLELIAQVGGQAAITLQLERDEVQDLIASLETAMRLHDPTMTEANPAPDDLIPPNEEPKP